MEQQPAAWDCLCRLLSLTWDPRRQDLPRSIPWQEVAALASRHAVVPLLRAALQQTGYQVPGDVQRLLDVAYFESAKYNAVRRQELIQLVAAFAEAQIPVVLLKGAALLETVYANIALRPMGDLDLLVPPRCVSACGDLLTDRGYTPLDIEFTPGAWQEYNNQQAFVTPGALPSVIELHWHLVDLPYYLRQVPVAWFWENTIPLQLDGYPIQVLNPEANVLHLVAHLAFHHRFQRLLWFVDLAVVVHQAGDSLDWEKILARAQEFEFLRVLQEGLDRLASYWPSLPVAIARQRAARLQPTALERRIFRLTTASPRSPMLDFYTDILCLPDLSSRLRFILQNTFPQAAYMADRYQLQHRWQLPYWYLVRLAEGLVKGLRSLSQMIRLR